MAGSGKLHQDPTRLRQTREVLKEGEYLSMDRCVPEGPPHARNQILNTMALTVAFWTIRQIGGRLSTDLTRTAETGHVVAQVTPGEWGFVPT